MAGILIAGAGQDQNAVPGFFSLPATTYGFELDIEKLRAESDTVAELGDVITIMTMPQGFVVLGASIETVIPSSTNTGFQLIKGGGDVFVDFGLSGDPGDRRYNVTADDIPQTVSAPAAVGRLLQLVMGDTGQDAAIDGVFKVSITGVFLHSRAQKTSAILPD